MEGGRSGQRERGGGSEGEGDRDKDRELSRFREWRKGLIEK